MKYKIGRAGIAILAAASMIAGPVTNANAWFDRDLQLVNTDKYSVNWWGRGQLQGVGEVVPDPYADHIRVYEFLKQARMGFDGQYDDLFKYQIELAYGGENQNSLQSMAGGYDLLDFVADVPIKPLGENTIFKIGQMRVPYGREALTDEGYTTFADKSIANLAANQGRDFGIAIMATKGNFTGTIGTFPGGGRDITQRYLPERLGMPEVVTRFGWNDGVDEDIYHVMATDLNLKRETKSIYFNALYTMDTRIGHSTALASHSVDNNLLVDTNYNPYIKWGDPYNNGANVSGICSANSCNRGHLFFVGTDATIRHPLGNGQAVEAEVEGNWGGYWNRYGAIHMASARAQGDYQVGQWQFGARYAILSIGKNAGFLSTTAPAGNIGTTTQALQGYLVNPQNPQVYDYSARMGKPIHEVDPSITYHFKGHALKLIADLPVYIDSPLYIDHTDGSYAMPDSTGVDEDSVLTAGGNSAVRRTYYEGRMLFQFQF